ncbi:hypothetical protein KV557_04390 [Kitasatospora aureofaciens]|uniref:hypothetical protein n=1 Tax=Kitasatospora aureofaciens TaxID=1894 RepID=UPI001C48A4AA|nr:hypothetical protein [Kitasatospora aureofaciens]MBV6696366.1 hypothetical protein [Kitasatospora aureofaciens]
MSAPWSYSRLRSSLDGRLDFSSPQDGSVGPPGLFGHFTLRLTPERLLRLRTQLAEIFDEAGAEAPSEADDAMDVTVFALLYGLRPGADSPGTGSSAAGSPGTES